MRIPNLISVFRSEAYMRHFYQDIVNFAKDYKFYRKIEFKWKHDETNKYLL